MSESKLKAPVLLVCDLSLPIWKNETKLLSKQRVDEMWLLKTRVCNPAPFESWGKRKKKNSNHVAMQQTQLFLGCRDALQMFSKKHVIKSYHWSQMRSVVAKTFAGWTTRPRSTHPGEVCDIHAKGNKFQSVSCIKSCRSESNRWRLSKASPSTRTLRGGNLGKPTFFLKAACSRFVSKNLEKKENLDTKDLHQTASMHSISHQKTPVSSNIPRDFLGFLELYLLRLQSREGFPQKIHAQQL